MKIVTELQATVGEGAIVDKYLFHTLRGKIFHFGEFSHQ
jgi:hypothetical protein